ncbi:hypothetical protein ACVJGD_004627 [Bradyrhizobium sp. USDA 10063]
MTYIGGFGGNGHAREAVVRAEVGDTHRADLLRLLRPCRRRGLEGSRKNRFAHGSGRRSRSSPAGMGNPSGARAQWMTKKGYRYLLRGGAANASQSRQAMACQEIAKAAILALLVSIRRRILVLFGVGQRNPQTLWCDGRRRTDGLFGALISAKASIDHCATRSDAHRATARTVDAQAEQTRATARGNENRATSGRSTGRWRVPCGQSTAHLRRRRPA